MSQLDLYDFEPTNVEELYKERLDKKINEKQTEIILSILSDGNAHSPDEFTDIGIKQYNARIFELRKQGNNIINVREGTGETYFILK